jgi:hypothetical protein
MFVVFHHPQSRYARKEAIEVCFVVNPPLKASLHSLSPSRQSALLISKKITKYTKEKQNKFRA